MREVDKVTNVATELADLGNEAEGLAGQLRKRIDSTRETLQIGHAVSDALGRADATLRGVFGVRSNESVANQQKTDASTKTDANVAAGQAPTEAPKAADGSGQ